MSSLESDLCWLLLPLALAGVSHPENLSGAAAKTAVGTGFVYDAIYLKHDTGTGHPERPERLTAIVDRLQQKGLLQDLVRLKPAAASLEWLTTVHTPEYVQRVKKAVRPEPAMWIRRMRPRHGILMRWR